jgi:hypothetical protein
VLAQTPVGAAPTKKKKEPPPPKVQETVGDLAFVVSNSEVKVEGVGLVRGLDNTGVDPSPSWARKQLVDEMSKAGVEKADKLLADPRLSMVIVRLTIPMGVAPTDPLDVQVEVPPNCNTTSLAGGYLLTTRLYEVAIAKGATMLRGHELALAEGPVMIGTPAKPNDPKVGRVLGGGRVKKDYHYTLVIKENRKSVRTSKMLETVVNQRFHQTDDGHQKGVATAKTDSYLVLKVPPLYHQNQERYFRVVQSLPMIDTPELRTRRLASWSQELLVPKTAGVAALKLEGLGVASVEALKTGLESPNPQVRFFAAEALAYLNDISGVDVLGETAVRQRDFRVYALAALAALDQAAAHLTLRKLMDQPDFEVRYGAFNALRVLDPNDGFLGRLRVLKEPKAEDTDRDQEPGDAMALAITAANRLRARQQDPFWLYAVDCEGPPCIHISRTRRAEIVLFGRQQKLLPPIVLDSGDIFLNAAENDERLDMSKIVPTRFNDGETKLTTGLELSEVIRQAASLGATYPQIVTLLETAHKQRNLPGQLVVDAVPRSNTVYLEAILGRDTTAKHDDALKQTSVDSSRPRWRRLFHLFDRTDRSQNPTQFASQDSTTQATMANTGSLGSSPQFDPNASTTDPANAKIGSVTDPNSTPKKDDAIQKTSGMATEPRRRWFDFFRNNDEP